MAMAKTNMTALLALMIGLAAPLPLFAQDAAAPTPAAPAADAPAAAPAADATAADAATDLSLGATEGAADPNGIGSSYTLAKFELWEQRCFKTESGIDPCQLYQLLKDSEGNSVAEITMFNLPDGTEGPAVAGASVVVPLETMLLNGVQLQIDTAKSKTYPFTFCTTAGCVSRVGFLAEEIEAMKKGAKATLTIVPALAPDQKVNLDVSLKGFTAGYTAMIEANVKSDAAIRAAGGN